VGKFLKIKRHFKQKTENIYFFLSKTTMCTSNTPIICFFSYFFTCDL